MLLNLANRKDQLTSMLRTTPGSLSTQDQRYLFQKEMHSYFGSNTLFSSEPSRSKKRAWGTPQETEATRDLDNRGLLDQQQLIMQRKFSFGCSLQCMRSCVLLCVGLWIWSEYVLAVGGVCMYHVQAASD